ncbi:MAG: YlxR family protein [Anaerolineales bacterium]
MKKSQAPRKHIPQRTCVGCREINAKRELIRLVRTPQGVFIDPSGKMAGRGAYLHRRRSCWEQGLRGALAHALRVELTAEDRVRLEAFLQTLPTEDEDGG